MTEVLTFRALGRPVPQGSKKAIRRGEKIAMIEMGKELRQWRKTISDAAVEAAENRTFYGPLQVSSTFVFPRPKNHYGTGRNAGVLKKDMPHYREVRPDLDKLLRALFDGLTMSGIIPDDASIVSSISFKIFGETPGVVVEVRSLG